MRMIIMCLHKLTLCLYRCTGFAHFYCWFYSNYTNNVLNQVIIIWSNIFKELSNETFICPRLNVYNRENVFRSSYRHMSLLFIFVASILCHWIITRPKFCDKSRVHDANHVERFGICSPKHKRFSNTFNTFQEFLLSHEKIDFSVIWNTRNKKSFKIREPLQFRWL